jgi:hypothetical protein
MVRLTGSFASNRIATLAVTVIGPITLREPYVRQRRQPGIWAAAAGILLGCAVTACSPGPPPIPTPTSSQAGQFRTSAAPALLVQCMLSQGTLGRSDSVFSGPPGWLRNGNIVITAATEAKFNDWYRANSGISVAGKTLTQWTQWAAANDKLPVEVCGPSVSAAALQRQVFGKDRAAGNPWGALSGSSW